MNTNIVVRVKSRTTKKSIEYFGNDRYLIKTESDDHNIINKEVVEMLSKYMGLAPNRIILKAGFSNQDKLLQII